MKLQFKPSRGNLAVAGASGLLLSGVASAQSTGGTVAPLDVSTGTQYLQDNASGNMSKVALVLFVLAGLGMAIVWVKATFFG